MTATVVLALGSNLGEREETLIRAIVDLCSHARIELRKVSPIAVTASVGGPAGQPDFLNMVVEIETDLRPFDLLRYCQSVENKHHRIRQVRWGPRTLDIDMITYAHLEMDEPELTLPHPLAGQRAFVLAPWARMDSSARLGGLPVAELASRAADAPGIRRFLEAPVMCR